MFGLRLGRKRVKKLNTVLRGLRCYLQLLLLGGALTAAATAARADLPRTALPVPCTTGCSAMGGPNGWITSGQASLSSTGSTLYVDQKSGKAILNWQSFNIGADARVQFNQPDADAVALNRIYQSDPSRIYGSLSANGQVYLINRNGILFGQGARVDVNSLTASTLNIDDATFNTGILQAITQKEAAFKSEGPMGSIVIDSGAELRSADGGRIMVLAPVIENRGRIETPGGQAILAASQDRVWLQAASKDDNLRGLLVEVGTGGDVRNLGGIIARRGNITLMGFAVNQDGLLSATTTVNSNGSIRLLARDASGDIQKGNSGYQFGKLSTERGDEAARVEFGTGSRTEVLPELEDDAVAVDEQAQPLSRVEVSAKEIVLREEARIVASGGVVDLTATVNPNAAVQSGAERNGSRVVLAEGSLIDVSGVATAVAPMSRNELEIELRANELKDSPLQRDGILRGKKVTIDIRKGAEIADISGALGTIERSVGERLAEGGTVKIASEGDVIMAHEATVDLSGGAVNYEAGWMNTTKLLSAGKVYDISDADPNLIYDGILGEYIRKDPKWGVTQSWRIAGPVAQGHYEEAYSEGKSAGTLKVTSSAVRLDGDVVAEVTRGKYQRDPESFPDLGTLELDLAKVGQGGVLYAPATLSFASGADDERFAAEDGLDPSQTITIDPLLLREGGVGRLIVNHNGAVVVPEATELRLPAGDELTISGDTITVDGAITAPGGAVSLSNMGTTGDFNRPVTLGEHGRIDVSGQWINDYASTGAAEGVEPLFVDGGSIKLEARGDLRLASGSQIAADGGAFVDEKGKLHVGDGGEITLISRLPVTEGSTLTLAGELHAYAPGEGGALSIEANAVRIAQSDGGDRTANELLLTPGFFQQGGFSGYTLTANLDGVTVEPGVVVQPHVQSVRLEGDYLSHATGSDISGFSHLTVLPDEQRPPVDLTLNLDQMALETADRPAHFSVGEGARIELDPQARLTLSSDHSIDLDGVLSAPAGEIEVKVKSDTTLYYTPEQGIRLGANARLLAPGVARAAPNLLGQPVGEVLSGGSVAVTAERGHIVMEPGAVIDVSGTAAELLVRSLDSSDGGSVQTLASSAGAIRLTAAEALALAGILAAHAGGTGAAGGELTVVMDANNRGVPDIAPPAPIPDFPFTPSTITLSSGGEAPSVERRPGQAVVSGAAVEAGGFDSLTLKATDQIRRDGRRLRGRIDLDRADLDLERSIVLDASIINQAEGDSRIAAAYVALANSNRSSAVEPAAEDEAGRLDIAAHHLDLIGNLTLQGWERAHLASEGDIRLRGLLPESNSGKEWLGSLNSFGDIELQGAQLYPATLTQYQIEVTRPEGELTLASTPGATPDPVLSAGGRLTLKADKIHQGGVVKAPVGSIEMVAADTLTLAPGSLTSTSAAGQIIPFGRSELGLDWVYPADENMTGEKTKLVFGVNAPLPAQGLELQAPVVAQEEGAVIDLSGGGDLYAYEFVAGLGGSRDVLAVENSGDSYAILPWLKGYGPYDPLEFHGADLKAGDSIHLAAGSRLPEGDYLLLPARYALLPGAFLVTRQAGTHDFSPARAVKQNDGSVLVGGYRTVQGSDIREARWSGYAVAPGAIARTRSEYQDSFANDFFTQRAEAVGQAAPLLPRDAGHLVIDVGSELQLAGELRAQHREGRGARVDIEAEHLAIVESPVVADGYVQLTAESINRLGAESLLLGGRRSEEGDAATLTVSATTVTVLDGVDVDAPELILAARDEVKVEAGARLAASGDVSATGVSYAVQGDGALLQLSGGAPVEIERSGAHGATGDLRVEAGATLAAVGSMYLESSRDTLIEGALEMEGGDLTLSAKRIALGDAPGDTAGLVLTQAQLGALHMDHLNLKSRETVDLHGDVELKMKALTVNAAGLIGHGVDASTITVEQLELKNAGNAKAVGVVSDSARLTVATEELLLGEGRFSLDGFAAAEISAGRQIRMAGNVDRSRSDKDDGTLVADGDLTLRTPVITAEAGSDTAIVAKGRLEVLALAASGEAEVSGLGARLSLEGSDVALGTAIQMPSGDVRLKAREGDVHLLSGAAIDVSGRVEEFGEERVATPAGEVTLHASSGDVIVESGAALLLKSVAEGDAGRLKVSAASGEFVFDGVVDGGDGAGAGQGNITLDLGTVADFSALNRKLNAGGFGGKRELRQRHGDLRVAESDLINAERVHLTVDEGALEMRGQIAAAAAKGGEVIMEAKGDLHLYDTARIDARATGEDEAGGRVVLATTDGEIAVDGGTVIDVSGTRSGADAALGRVGGRVELRAPRVGDGVAVTSLAGEIRGAESISVEAFRRYEAAEADSALQEQILADSRDYMSHAGQITERLNMADDPRFHLRPGVEIFSNGDLTVSEEWDLAARDGDALRWRFDGEAGVLTMRAQERLIFDKAVKDGVETDPAAMERLGRLLEGDSWSFRFAGGADLDSADPLAVKAGRGGAVLGAGVQIHTGSGDIELASGGDLKFEDEGAAIFSAGRSGGYGALPMELQAYGFPGVYPVRGGDVRLGVAGDIISAGTDQLISQWLYRMGDFGDGGVMPTSWAVNFIDVTSGEALFKQNLGVFGGGALTVEAGGDIKDLSAVAPTTGRPEGHYSGNLDKGFVTNEFTVLGGGDIDISAGGDIEGGIFYVDGGVGKIKAGDSLLAGEKEMAPLLALGDARFEVEARRDLTLESVLNSTVLPMSQAEINFWGALSYFFSYGEGSGVDLTSVAGDVALRNRTAGLTDIANFPGLVNFEDSMIDLLTLYPGNLGVAALQGDIFIDDSFKMFPASKGDLSLLADGDITTRAASDQAVVVNMSDADPALLPQRDDPTATGLADIQSRLYFGGETSKIHAATPVHSGDEQPVIIVARNGSLQSDDEFTLSFHLPEQARLTAGKDIRNITFSGQNLAEGDLTQLKAGRDIVYNNVRNNAGQRMPSTMGVTLAGPGELELVAGRNIDLGTSEGVVTTGDTLNPALAESGAAVTLETGVNTPVDFAAYLNHYAPLDESLASTLVDEMERITGRAGLSGQEALVLLAAQPQEIARGLALAHFYDELKGSALEAAKGEGDGYQRGYDAIAALFGEADYQGDLRLYFSRIHTVDDGGINILVPGGLINAGLASVKGINKEAGDLGIVAQRSGAVNIYLDQDMLVNQSRVFALDGGDIVIWSQHGDIDAGRGAKSALAAPSPAVTFDDTGKMKVEFPAAIAGSGIRTVVSTPGRAPGGVTLAAPSGAVIANDAGIDSSGGLVLAATEVLGADNISAGGEAVGVPSIEPPSVSASVANAGNAAASAGDGEQKLETAPSKTPLADSALAFLEVEVLGFGASATEIAEAEPVAGENEKARGQDKGNRLARDEEEASPSMAEGEKPAGHVASTPDQ